MLSFNEETPEQKGKKGSTGVPGSLILVGALLDEQAHNLRMALKRLLQFGV